MTQQVGLITFLKLKAKAVFKKRVSPSSSKKNDASEDIRKLFANRGYQSSTYTSKNGDVYIKNGKRLKPGTPEYKAFKKDMDEFQVEMTDWSKEFGRDMQDMANDLRNMFK